MPKRSVCVEHNADAMRGEGHIAQTGSEHTRDIREGRWTNAELARLANAACTVKHLGTPRRLGTGQASRVAQDIECISQRTLIT